MGPIQDKKAMYKGHTRLYLVVGYMAQHCTGVPRVFREPAMWACPKNRGPLLSVSL